MRPALLLALLAASASAQTDSLDARARVDAQVAESRARLAALPDTPTFEAAWVEGPTRIGDGMGGNADRGLLESRGTGLAQVLVWSWTLQFPFRGDPLSTSVRRRLVDGPDSLLHRPLAVRMAQPGLARAEYGPFLRDRLAEALGLQIRFEDRPQVVYALRVRHPERVPASGGERWGWGSGDQTFYARDLTGPELASALGSALGHVVVDETGFGGRTTLQLEFDSGAVDFEAWTMPAPAIDAVRRQLEEETGFELVPEVRPVEWMVVRAAR